MAKFEANIPSYLRSGAGSVPIDNNFAKVDSEPENLSQVIDNYTNNFSGLVKSPDDMSMVSSVKPIPGQQPLPFPEEPGEPDPMDDELPKLLQESISNNQVEPIEPTIPSDADIEDILVA
jgi:hypothetical protein